MTARLLAQPTLSRSAFDGQIRSGLDKIGAEDIAHLLLYAPHKFRDFTKFHSIANLNRLVGEKTNLYVRLTEPIKQEPARRGQPPKFRLAVEDAKVQPGRRAPTMFLTVFGDHMEMGFGELIVGEAFGLHGKADVYVAGNGVEYGSLKSPIMIPAGFNGRVCPRYKPVRGNAIMSGVGIHALILQSLNDEKTISAVSGYLSGKFGGRSETEMLEEAKSDFQSFSQLFLSLHYPKTEQQLNDAIHVARRLSAIYLTNEAKRASVRETSLRSRISIDEDQRMDAIIALPFPLTKGKGGQYAAISQIIEDMEAPYPMNRLISGDVGCGKTIVYGVPAALSQQNGKHVMVMMPNLLLANQVFNEIKSTFPKTPVVFVESGSDKVDLSKNPILFGTQALINWVKKNPTWKADLVVIDESQKFSREQRDSVITPHTNVIEATATCIPRTAALAMYGHLDVSIISKMPVEKKIHTRIVTKDDRRDVYRAVHEAISRGEQVAIIYPLVAPGKTGEGVEEDLSRFENVERISEEQEEDAKKSKKIDPKYSVEQGFLAWEQQFPGQVIALHGKLKSGEKIAVLDEIKSGKFNIIVASSVIEIGITLPSLKTLIVIHPDRYGVSTLHQMRGRVARHGGEGNCFLYAPEELAPESLDRLKLLEKHTSGHVLAEEDMRQRGFGDLNKLSEKQHGGSPTLFLGVELLPVDFEFYVDNEKTIKESLDAPIQSQSCFAEP